MNICVENLVAGKAGSVVVTCPACGNSGTFNKITDNDLHVYNGPNGYWLGHRMCPNDKCGAHVFFVKKGNGEIKTYPAIRIDFRSENIPPRIKSTLSEAISCYSEGCYVAAAIMVRRTLEELCEDKKSSGDNLKKKIEHLKSIVVLPQELFEALNELRLFGNDAAHIESKEFEKVGKEGVEIAIELTKEILKAVYQMESLVKRLKSFKKT